MLNPFYLICIQEKELNAGDFLRKMFNIGARSDEDELISFKLYVMIDTT